MKSLSAKEKKKRELEKLTKEELIAKFLLFYSRETMMDTYIILDEQIADINKQFADGHIDVMSEKDNPSFDRWIKFSKEISNIEKAQIERLEQLDEDILLSRRADRMAAKTGTPEQMAAKYAKKKTN